MKRLLLVVDDAISSGFYREAIESAGFAVDVVTGIEEAAAAAAANPPELVMVDLFLKQPPAPDTIIALRRTPGLEQVPLLVLPTLPKSLAKSAIKAGALKVIDRNAGLRAAVIDESLGALGTPSFTPPGFSGSKECGEKVIAAAKDAITAMRMGVRDFVGNSTAAGTFYPTLRLAHFLSVQSCYAQLKGIWQFAGAVESFIYDLFKMPEQANPSALRTLTEAIDLLAVLCTPENYLRLGDPSKAKILTVDDDPMIGEQITIALERGSLKTHWAMDMAGALSSLREAQYDMIFLDIGLGGSSGFDLCKEIRDHPQYEHTPIVFVTGMTTFQNRVQSSLSGGNDFIGKPFNLFELPVKAMIWILKGQLGLL
jgi:DNA-binding response OmpR family regulator